MEQLDSHQLENSYKGSVSVLKLRISDLENEIGIIFNRIQHLKQKSINKNFLLETMSKKIQLSTVKLRSYQSEVQSILQKTNYHQKFQSMREINAQKKQALGDLQILFDVSALSETNDTSHNLRITENEIQSKIINKTWQLHQIKNDMLTSVKELEMQLNNIKEEELQIEQTIKVIHKRNAAQLLRLKRLINEAQLREQYWSAEVQ